MLLKSKDHPFIIICSDAIFTEPIDSERKGRRMCRHVYNGRVPMARPLAQTSERPNFEISPSLANVCDSHPHLKK
jgi:hypothetical protein